MREIRDGVLIVLVAIFIAAGLLWTLSAQDPSPIPSPSSEAVPSQNGRQVVLQDPIGTSDPQPSGGKSDETQDTAESEVASATSSLSIPLVWGAIKTEYDEVVPAQSVELYSLSLGQQHTAISNKHGEFVFHDVEPAADYQVSVSPKGDYKDYRNSGLKIDANNTSFEIVLEVLQTGQLRGRVVNLRGEPVPGFRLWIRSWAKDRGIRNTRSDSVGLFQIEDFPQGPFEVTSRLVPLRISGLLFEPGTDELVTLVVDHGPHRLNGRVFDRHSQPVEGATVVLSWAYTQGDVRSTVDRRTLTGANGGFVIGGLAYGEHELVISASNGTALKRTVVVGEVPAGMVLYLDDSRFPE